MRALAFCLIPALALLGAAAAGDPPAKGDAKLDTFRAYLKQQYPEKKWQAGPTKLDTAALRAAYPGDAFYFVFSRPPLPPGANLPEVQEAYRRRVEEFRKTQLSLTARVDAKGEVVPLRKAADYNPGLVKVTSDDEARTAAAAILSLHGEGQVSPGAVDAKDVKVTKDAKGWSCQVERANQYFGAVTFDARGRCTAVSKAYAGPVPP